MSDTNAIRTQGAASPRWGPGSAAAAILLVGLAVIAGAWGFELIGGYEPCALCLEQRWPYYLGLPLAALAAIGAALGCRRCAAIGLLGVTLIFAYGTGLAAYHAGIEWGFWPGPAACSGGAAGLPTSAAGLAASLETAHVPSCTEAAWRLAGISLAGYNAVISLGLTVAAGLGAWAGLRAAR